jgi:hypothetical protein
VLRPVVPVRLIGPDTSTPVSALVDSGSEHILAAPWLASDVAVDLTNPKFVTTIWVAGGNPEVTFVDLLIRLQHPDGDDDVFVEWVHRLHAPFSRPHRHRGLGCLRCEVWDRAGRGRSAPRQVRAVTASINFAMRIGRFPPLVPRRTTGRRGTGRRPKSPSAYGTRMASPCLRRA